METIRAATGDTEIIAAVNLLSMGIKTVPESILRKEFSRTATTLLELLGRFSDDSKHQNVLRSVCNVRNNLLLIGFVFLENNVDWLTYDS